MKKRLFDADQFTDSWFRRLPPDAKLLWVFLYSNCDASGVWSQDAEFFQYLTGIKADLADLVRSLGERVICLSKERLLIPKFVHFQQGGKLSEAKASHRGIIKLFEKHKLEMDENGMVMPSDNEKHGIAMAYPRHTHGIGMAYPCHSDGIPMPSGLVYSSLSLVNEEGVAGGETKKVGKGMAEVPDSLNTPEFTSAWADYMEYRKEVKLKKLSAKGVRLKFAHLSKYPVADVILAIELTISNGWTRINPDWIRNGKPTYEKPDYEDPLST